MFVSYCEVMGVGPDGIHSLADSEAPLNDLALRFGSPNLAAALDLATTVTAFSGVLGGMAAAAGVLFALGRAGMGCRENPRGFRLSGRRIGSDCRPLFPVGHARYLAEPQAVLLKQVVRRRGFAAPAQIIRCGADDKPNVVELADNEFRVFQGSNAKSNIDTLLGTRAPFACSDRVPSRQPLPRSAAPVRSRSDRNQSARDGGSSSRRAWSRGPLRVP